MVGAGREPGEGQVLQDDGAALVGQAGAQLVLAGQGAADAGQGRHEAAHQAGVPVTLLGSPGLQEERVETLCWPGGHQVDCEDIVSDQSLSLSLLPWYLLFLLY